MREMIPFFGLVFALISASVAAADLPLGQIKMPPGFAIELWARVDNARQMALPAGVKDLNDYHKAGGRILDLVTFEIMQARWKEKPIAMHNIVDRLESDWRALQDDQEQEDTLERFLGNLAQYESAGS